MRPANYKFNPDLVSPSCLAFIRKSEADHREWQRRRVTLKKGWWYNPATEMAEPHSETHKRVATKVAAKHKIAA